VAVAWTPIDHVKFLINYGHLVYGDAAVAAAGGARDYSVDALGLRAQIDF
jgi:phosphate-selective porin OprO/OprP